MSNLLEKTQGYNQEIKSIEDKFLTDDAPEKALLDDHKSKVNKVLVILTEESPQINEYDGDSKLREILLEDAALSADKTTEEIETEHESIINDVTLGVIEQYKEQFENYKEEAASYIENCNDGLLEANEEEKNVILRVLDELNKYIIDVSSYIENTKTLNELSPSMVAKLFTELSEIVSPLKALEIFDFSN